MFISRATNTYKHHHYKNLYFYAGITNSFKDAGVTRLKKTFLCTGLPILLEILHAIAMVSPVDAYFIYSIKQS